MRVVLVSSPGRPPRPHWSDAAAIDLAAALRAWDAEVEWLRVAGASVPSVDLPGVDTHAVVPPRPAPLHRVGTGMQHPTLEHELVRRLRRRHADAVLHVGVGAGGSPNVLWLAERMGSRVYAFARGAEVVCHRGDLVDAGGNACTRHDDAVTCRLCCARSWWARPHAHEFENRWDLLVGGLLVAEAVFVDEPAQVEMLAALGVSHRRLFAGLGAAAIAQRIVGDQR